MWKTREHRVPERCYSFRSLHGRLNCQRCSKPYSSSSTLPDASFHQHAGSTCDKEKTHTSPAGRGGRLLRLRQYPRSPQPVGGPAAIRALLMTRCSAGVNRCAFGHAETFAHARALDRKAGGGGQCISPGWATHITVAVCGQCGHESFPVSPSTVGGCSCDGGRCADS